MIKKILMTLTCFILLFAYVFMMAGCASDPVLPPARCGKNAVDMYFLSNRTLSDMCQEADAIVRVKIGDWLYETDWEWDLDFIRENGMDFPTTFYEAEVLHCYKGDVPKKIILRQVGNTELSFDQPFYTAGNDILFFLKRDDSDADQVSYSPVQEGIHVYDVTYDQKGDVYYMQRQFESCVDDVDFPTNYIEKKDELMETIADDVTKRQQNRCEYIYSEKDFSELLTKMIQKSK